MHKTHPVFVAPTDPDVTVWRYMDLPKLISLLQHKALWFARADTLGDAHEGSYGKANVAARPVVYEGQDPELLRAISTTTAMLPRHTYVNCWHMSDVESVAMWKIYAPSGQGVAIRSTYARLTSSLQGDRDTFVGRVRYVDPAKEFIPENNTMAPFVHKRLSFAYEHELRAMFTDYPSQGGELTLAVASPPGHLVPVDVDALIESVFVAPAQPGWFADAVRYVVACAGMDSGRVFQSDLDQDPVY